MIGHGGGAASQHDHCKSISWSEAQPGDLVFYPGDTHVGVFVGKDSSGDPFLIKKYKDPGTVQLPYRDLLI